MNGPLHQSLKRKRSKDFAYASGSEVKLVITILKASLLVGLLASILFAHGCHGDEDHELFTALKSCVTTANGGR